MQVSIYKVPVNPSEWVPTLRPHQFEPIHPDDQPVAVVECPAGWMLIGSPHALLVQRQGDHDFTSRTATDVLTLAGGNADGFSFVVPPREGAAGAVQMARVQAELTAKRADRAIEASHANGNGKALAAPRKKA